MDRSNLSLVGKLGAKIKTLNHMARSVVRREITIRQAGLELWMYVSNTQRNLKDDFDWSKYHSYYQEELKSISKVHTLVLDAESWTFIDGVLSSSEANALPLHPNHKLLYETILELNPSSALEAGCGGGDHLHNLKTLRRDLVLHGVDRSDMQLRTLFARHPNLDASTKVSDLTVSDLMLPKVDLVYSQAVLMHISEVQDRFQIALRNLLNAAQESLVLMENWSQHDFKHHLETIMEDTPGWKNAKLYFRKSSQDESIRIMIVSKKNLPYDVVSDYELLLMGNKLVTH
jgi:hypothetical protein